MTLFGGSSLSSTVVGGRETAGEMKLSGRRRRGFEGRGKVEGYYVEVVESFCVL